MNQKENSMLELPLCKCGCGLQVEKKFKKYFGDHYRNPPMTASPSAEPVIADISIIPMASNVEIPTEIKIIKSKKEFEKIFGSVSEIKKLKKITRGKEIIIKSKTKPIPGGKISKQNLLNVGLGIYTC